MSVTVEVGARCKLLLHGDNGASNAPDTEAFHTNYLLLQCAIASEDLQKSLGGNEKQLAFQCLWLILS